ncbi:hypothetical protein [Marinilactibacillus kalidii]|uniref:hypothetical protein n=1 Tax=Marinilactibacillus kalidii TaxID=2820274 RepID=UPI001ABE5ABB|nr:hypothetical protein [Marinilactibacillus kalidii]
MDNAKVDIRDIKESLNNENKKAVIFELTVDLYRGSLIKLTSLEETTFKPITERTFFNTLKNGMWKVGTDIEVGNYNVYNKENSGKLIIYEVNNEVPRTIDN